MSTSLSEIIEINSVLERVSECTHSKSDVDLAFALGVTRQVLFGWKKRGNIPFEKLVEFAFDKALDINWLLSGISSSNTSTNAEINLKLFQEIQNCLYDDWKYLNAVDFGYFTTLIYNQVYLEDNYSIRSQKIKSSVSMLILANERKLLEVTGSNNNFPNEAKEKLIQATNKSIADHEDTVLTAAKTIRNIITQEVKGNDNKVAGGDISNNEK